MNMGKSRKIAVTDYIGYIMDIEQGSNIVHYLAWVFLIASILVTVLVTPAHNCVGSIFNNYLLQV